MRTRVAAVALGLMIAVVWPTAGWARGDPSESTQPATPWGPFPWVDANPLGLTADQVTGIQQIVTRWQAELTPIWTDLQAVNLEVERLMMDPASEPADVAAKMRGIGELQAVIQQKALERRNALRSALTDDQRAVFDRQGLGYGQGYGPCGMGLGAGWFGGGRGRGGACLFPREFDGGCLVRPLDREHERRHAECLAREVLHPGELLALAGLDVGHSGVRLVLGVVLGVL